jgi:hypothetical protein
MNRYTLILKDGVGSKVRFDLIDAETHEQAAIEYKKQNPDAVILTVGLFKEGVESES